MAGKHTLEGKNGEIALKMLKDVTNILDKNHIDYWLEGGTLLGVIRENRLLPWDNDMDISIKEDYLDKLLISLKQLKGYRIRTKTFLKDNDPFIKDKVRIVKIRNKKLFFFRGDVTLDIFIKFKKENSYFWQVGTKRKSVDKKFLCI